MMRIWMPTRQHQHNHRVSLPKNVVEFQLQGCLKFSILIVCTSSVEVSKVSVHLIDNLLNKAFSLKKINVLICVFQVFFFKVSDAKEPRLQRYSHPFVSIRVVELHVVARLNPADGPRLFPGHWRHKDAGTGSEVRRPVAQDHDR